MIVTELSDWLDEKGGKKEVIKHGSQGLRLSSLSG
jgi:hypothetical protein